MMLPDSFYHHLNKKNEPGSQDHKDDHSFHAYIITHNIPSGRFHTVSVENFEG